jgi:hypothetical protein
VCNIPPIRLRNCLHPLASGMDHPSPVQLGPALKETLRAIDRLLQMFRVERVLHLIIGVIAFLLLMYVTGLLLVTHGVDTTLAVLLFGSSGLITISTARITYFFNKAFSLVEDVVRGLTGTGGAQ